MKVDRLTLSCDDWGDDEQRRCEAVGSVKASPSGTTLYVYRIAPRVPAGIFASEVDRDHVLLGVVEPGVSLGEVKRRPLMVDVYQTSTEHLCQRRVDVEDLRRVGVGMASVPAQQ